MVLLVLTSVWKIHPRPGVLPRVLIHCVILLVLGLLVKLPACNAAVQTQIFKEEQSVRLVQAGLSP